MPRREATIFFVLGTGFIIVGGLISALAPQLQWERGTWLVAYLVLVGGVGQAAIGPAQHLLAARPLRPTTVWVQLVAFNLGNALVIAGTLCGSPWVVDLGGVALVVTLVPSLLAVRAAPRPRAAWLYRGLLVVLIVSIPIGLLLAHLRSG